jgi:hypothetical protein
MPPIVLVLAAIVIVSFASLSIISVKNSSPLIASLVTICAVPLLAFFCFGFAASFEGSGGIFLWSRVIYIALFFFVVGTTVFTWKRSGANSGTRSIQS